MGVTVAPDRPVSVAGQVPEGKAAAVHVHEDNRRGVIIVHVYAGMADERDRRAYGLPEGAVVAGRRHDILIHVDAAVCPVRAVMAFRQFFPADQEIVMGTVGLIISADRVVPGTVHIVVLPPDRDQIPGMADGLAGDHRSVQAALSAQIGKGQRITLADRAPDDQRVVGVIPLVRQVILAMGNQIVMQKQQLFHIIPAAIHHPQDLLYGAPISLHVGIGVGIVILRLNAGNHAVGILPVNKKSRGIKQVRVFIEHFPEDPPNIVNRHPVRFELN